jgi:transposase
VISKYKTGKHFQITIADTSLTVERKQAQIGEETALDGFYVLRTPIPASRLDAPAVVTAYKNLSRVERDFRSIKTDDLDLRPVFHRLEERVKAHVLICMLGCYLTWHLRKAWAHSPSPTRTRPRPPTRCSRPPAPQPPPKPPASTTNTAAPTTASAASSATWPP